MRRKGFINVLALCALITGLSVFAAGEAKAQTKSKTEPPKAEPRKEEPKKKEEPTALTRSPIRRERGNDTLAGGLRLKERPPNPQSAIVPKRKQDVDVIIRLPVRWGSRR